MLRNLWDVDGLMMWFTRCSGGRGIGLCFPCWLGSGSRLRDMCKRANLSISKLELWEANHLFAPLGRVIMLLSLSLFSWKELPVARNTVLSTKADLSSLGSMDGVMRLWVLVRCTRSSEMIDDVKTRLTLNRF